MSSIMFIEVIFKTQCHIPGAIYTMDKTLHNFEIMFNMYSKVLKIAFFMF